MASRRWSGIVVSLLVVAVIFAACAKQPATMSPAAASAPAPVAESVRADSTAEAPQGAGPTGGAPRQPSGTTATPAPPAGGPVAAARPAPSEFAAVPDVKDIFFDFDKYDVRPTDAKILDANAAWLKTNANMLVLIEGHCDERGTNEYNLALGERRAKAAMNYLVSQGVQASRITIISYGEERPVCTERTEACWAKNRRAHFLVKPR